MKAREIFDLLKNAGVLSNAEEALEILEKHYCCRVITEFTIEDVRYEVNRVIDDTDPDDTKGRDKLAALEDLTEANLLGILRDAELHAAAMGVEESLSLEHIRTAIDLAI